MQDDELVGRVRHPVRGTARRRPRLTRHAVERWSQRVDGTSPVTLAGPALERFLRRGRRRPRPRHWTTAQPEPGTVFIYAAELPGVCAVVRDGAVVTVLTRALCRGGAA